MNRSTGRIDFQFHFSPSFYTEKVAQTGKHITTDRWSVAAAHAYMDRNDVATGMLSVSTPGVDFVGKPESVTLARRLNEAATALAQREPMRFGNFATLPMQDVDATLKEIEYCFDTLGMDGVCMMSNTRSVYPGNPAFDDIFDERPTPAYRTPLAWGRISLNGCSTRRVPRPIWSSAARSDVAETSV